MVSRAAAKLCPFTGCGLTPVPEPAIVCGPDGRRRGALLGSGLKPVDCDVEGLDVSVRGRGVSEPEAFERQRVGEPPVAAGKGGEIDVKLVRLAVAGHCAGTKEIPSAEGVLEEHSDVNRMPAVVAPAFWRGPSGDAEPGRVTGQRYRPQREALGTIAAAAPARPPSGSRSGLKVTRWASLVASRARISAVREPTVPESR